MAYRPTERTEARKAATRERIAAAALAQVAEGGYASATVRAVAARRRRGRRAPSTATSPRRPSCSPRCSARAAQRELDVVAEVTAADGRPAAERVAAGAEAFCRRALAGPVLAYA